MGRFEDERGTIEDIIPGGKIDCVTRILTKKGAVRGNHYHKHTTQWTYVVSGRLLVPSGGEMLPGQMRMDAPGEPHAWKALEDTVCLVFTRGPRGEDYESDTHRLEEPLL
jgi:quercetin dioxygenase-like cupin family protein